MTCSKDCNWLHSRLTHQLLLCCQVSLESVDTELLLEAIYKDLKRCKGPTREFQRAQLSAAVWNHPANHEYTELPVRRQNALKVCQVCVGVLATMSYFITVLRPAYTPGGWCFMRSPMLPTCAGSR